MKHIHWILLLPLLLLLLLLPACEEELKVQVREVPIAEVAGVVVDQYGVGNRRVGGELARIARVSGSDRDRAGAAGPDLVVAVAQLRGVLAAVQSAEVAQEDDHDRTLIPERAEPAPDVGDVAQLDI